MAEICRATLGPTAYLLLEQFVVKGARTGLELGWHQDAGYIPFECSPYVTVWIALDDVDERNGTLYLLAVLASRHPRAHRAPIHAREPRHDRVFR